MNDCFLKPFCPVFFCFKFELSSSINCSPITLIAVELAKSPPRWPPIPSAITARMIPSAVYRQPHYLRYRSFSADIRQDFKLQRSSPLSASTFSAPITFFPKSRNKKAIASKVLWKYLKCIIFNFQFFDFLPVAAMEFSPYPNDVLRNCSTIPLIFCILYCTRTIDNDAIRFNQFTGRIEKLGLDLTSNHRNQLLSCCT